MGTDTSLATLAPAFGLLAGLISVACNVPYVRDILRRTTSPHRGSWLIWCVLEVVAVGAQVADGARWSVLPLLVQAAGTCLIIGLAIRLGSGGLSRLDVALLGVAGVGVVGWLTADEPVVATGCVIAADVVAALMMLPKAWRDPDSETLSTYVLAAASGAFTVLAVGSMEPSLLAYPLYYVLVNVVLSSAIVLGRAARQPHAHAAHLAPPRELATAA